MASQDRGQGTRKGKRKQTRQKEGKVTEKKRKIREIKKEKRAKMTAQMISWDLFPGQVWGLRGHSLPQASPTATSGVCHPSIFPLSSSAIHACLNPFQSWRPSYLGNRVKSLIADVSRNQTHCWPESSKRASETCRDNFAHMHAPVKCSAD